MPGDAYARKKVRYVSEETRMKMKAAARKMWRNPEYRKKNRGSLGRHWQLSEETRRKLRERPSPMLGRHHSEETKRKMREVRMRRRLIGKATGRAKG